MNRVPPRPKARRATNVTLPEDLVAQARDLGVNVSKACETGLRNAVTDARREAWLREARPGIEAYNEYVEKHGLPLAEYRQF